MRDLNKDEKQIAAIIRGFNEDQQTACAIAYAGARVNDMDFPYTSFLFEAISGLYEKSNTWEKTR